MVVGDVVDEGTLFTLAFLEPLAKAGLLANVGFDAAITLVWSLLGDGLQVRYTSQPLARARIRPVSVVRHPSTAISCDPATSCVPASSSSSSTIRTLSSSAKATSTATRPCGKVSCDQ